MTDALTPDQRLAALGLVLPEVPTPVANYVPFVRTGDLVVVSGQLPMQDGKPAAKIRLQPDFTVSAGPGSQWNDVCRTSFRHPPVHLDLLQCNEPVHLRERKARPRFIIKVIRGHAHLSHLCNMFASPLVVRK